jgi:hypothetical protein
MQFGAGGMSAAPPFKYRLASEQTPRERLAIRANAPLEPRKAQRPADHGLFDTNARNQIEMF